MNSRIKISGKQVLGLALTFCLGLFLLIAGCEKEKVLPREFPKLRTMEVSDISTEGAAFEGVIEKEGSEPIIDWGFVWDINQNPKIETAEYYLESYSPGKNALQRDVLSTLIAGEHYSVKFFARTASYAVYGNEVVFESLGSRGPEISSFFPEQGPLGTQVSIHGTGFRQVEIGNIVRFDTVRAEVLSTSDTVLVVTVPSSLQAKKVKVSVQVADERYTSAKDFEVLGATISSFYPKSGTIGDTVTIEGNYLWSSSAETQVFFYNSASQLIEQSENKLRVLVPDVLDSSTATIGLKLGNQTTNASDRFTFTKPEIISITPETANSGDTLTIVGNNFSLIPAANKITIDNLVCPVVSSTKTNLKIIASYQGYVLPFPSTKPVSSKVELQIASVKSNLYSKFKFNTPTISSFSPEKPTFLDIVSIYGSGFIGIKDELRVRTGDVEAEILSITDTELRFQIPKGDLVSRALTVSSMYFSSTYTNFIAHPEIYSVQPSVATYGEQIIIKGEFFNPELPINKVYLNNIAVPITSASLTELKVVIPNNLKAPDGRIEVTVSTGSGLSWALTQTNKLSLLTPEISSVSPLIISQENNQIVLDGVGFNPDTNEMDLWIDGNNFTITSAENNRIIASFPFEKYAYDPSSLVFQGNLWLQCGGMHVGSDEIVRVVRKSVWYQRAYFPSEPHSSATSFSVNSKGYILCGNKSTDFFSDAKPTDEMWEFDPQSDNWFKKNNFPGGARYSMFSAYDANNAFVGFGTGASSSLFDKGIWRYHQNSDYWEAIPLFPGVSRELAIAFLIGDNLYVGGGYVAEGSSAPDFWKYNIQTMQWTQLNDILYLIGERATHPVGNVVIDGKGFSFIQSYKPDGSGNYVAYTGILIYDPLDDSWNIINGSPFENATGNLYYPNFALGGKWYFQKAYYKLAVFDPKAAEKWSEIGGKPGDQRWWGTAYSLGNKGYFTLGFTNSDNWEFDPSKLP